MLTGSSVRPTDRARMSAPHSSTAPKSPDSSMVPRRLAFVSLRALWGARSPTKLTRPVRLTTQTTATKTVADFKEKNVGDTDSFIVDLSTVPDAVAVNYSVKAVNAEGKHSQASKVHTVVPGQISGVSAPGAEPSGLRLSGRELSFEGSAGDAVRVFNAAGMLVDSATADASGRASLRFPAPGLYIVAVPDGAARMMVR